MAAVPTDDRLFRVAFEGTSEALLLVDDGGACVDANGAAEALFDSPGEELVGRSIDEFLPTETDDGRGVLEDKSVRGTLDTRRDGGDVGTVEYATIEGVVPGVHLSAIRDERNGESDLYRKTELLTNVFETSSAGILIVGTDGVILDVNDRIESLFGFERESILDRSYDDDRWRPVRDHGAEGEFPFSAVMEGETVFGLEYGIERPDREIVWLSVDAVPMYDDGEISFALAVVSDITDRREYRRVLEQQNDRLEEYSAAVSHDLRSPLSIASGWLDLAIEEDSTEPLETVRDALDRMEELIADLRALGRYGQTVEEMVEVDLSELAETAWSNVDVTAATLEAESDLGTIDGERGRILQLFESLFHNSVEHGGPDVTVRVGSLDSGFYVADDGPGISPDDRGSVFDIGYSTIEENGIGLAMVEAIAEAHGWRFELLDVDPHGTRFEFCPGWHPERNGG